MNSNSIAETDKKMDDVRSLLGDFSLRMGVGEAAKVLGVKTCVIRGAIERGEMSYIQIPGTARVAVTPEFLADWLRCYCVHQKPFIPA